MNWLNRARKVMPGGVSSPVRAFPWERIRTFQNRSSMTVKTSLISLTLIIYLLTQKDHISSYSQASLPYRLIRYHLKSQALMKWYRLTF